MDSGKILVAKHNGTYIIKLCGDVRVTLCSPLSNYINKIFSAGNAHEVVVDMEETEGADSTTLGLLAKLAIYCNRNLSLRPKIFCMNRDVYQVMDSMSFNDIFDIYQYGTSENWPLEELPPCTLDICDIKEEVLEAHRLLIKLNPDKESEFIDLINALEKE